MSFNGLTFVFSVLGITHMLVRMDLQVNRPQREVGCWPKRPLERLKVEFHGVGLLFLESIYNHVSS